MGCGLKRCALHIWRHLLGTRMSAVTEKAKQSILELEHSSTLSQKHTHTHIHSLSLSHTPIAMETAQPPSSPVIHRSLMHAAVLVCVCVCVCVCVYVWACFSCAL